MKKLVALFLLATMLLSFCACGSAAPKAFSSNGMTITLTSAFKEVSQEGYTVCFDSKDVAVFALKEKFTGTNIMVDGSSGNMKKDSELTLREYAKLVREANITKTPTPTTEVEGLTTFEFSFLNEELNQTYKYFCVMYKTSDAFWLIQFATLESKYEDNYASILEWAKSVNFD